MTNAPTLSVVMCTLGRDEMRASLRSVLASLDASGVHGEVVLVWQAEAPPPELPPAVRVLEVLPAGLSYARNRGIAAASADRIAFVDDDELATPGWAAGVLAGFADGADAVVGPVDPADDEGRPYCVLEGDEERWVGLHERPWNAGTGGNMALSRAVLDQVGAFELRLGAGSAGRAAEDTHLIARLQRAGVRIRWRPEMRLRHPTKTDAEVLESRYPYGFGAGRMARLLSSPRLASKYAVDIGWASVAVARSRDPQAARELAATGRGFAAGALRQDRWLAPASLLERAPAEVRAALAGEHVRGLEVPHREDPHFLYRAGDRLLHVYAEVSDGRREALRARERLAATGLPLGVPQLHLAVETPTALWVLEDRVPGRPAEPAERPAWWDGAASLLVELSRTSGPPLREGAWWAVTRERLPRGAPERWSDAVNAALDRLGDHPAVVVHGDVQPKNLVVQDGRVGLVDWDGALTDGPPGLDALFLRLTAGGGRDAAALVSLVEGGDGALLAQLGLDREAAAAAALVALASWADVEGRRRRPGPFAELLDAAAQALISA